MRSWRPTAGTGDTTWPRSPVSDNATAGGLDICLMYGKRASFAEMLRWVRAG